MERRNFMKLCCLNAAMFWLCMPLCAQSQMKTGVMRGVVRDSTGVVLSSVTITLKHLGIGISRTYQTSSKGSFSAALLPVGIYELSARLISFTGVTIPTIAVVAGRTRAIEVVMSLSALSTRIEEQDKVSVKNSCQLSSSAIFDNSQAPSLGMNSRAPTSRQIHGQFHLQIAGKNRF
jgi:hypothetical protein